MSAMYFDTRHLIFRRSILPKDAPERKELEASVRYLRPELSDRGFRTFLFLINCTENVGRALAWILVALGLNGLRWKIAETLKGEY